MNQRVSAPARTFAAIALVCGFLVVVIVVATSLGGDGGGSADGLRPAGQATSGGSDNGSTPKVYVVQNGDTLTSIAHRTGVSVLRIQALNPGVDPQILISGEKLKLR